MDRVILTSCRRIHTSVENFRLAGFLTVRIIIFCLLPFQVGEFLDEVVVDFYKAGVYLGALI